MVLRTFLVIRVSKLALGLVLVGTLNGLAKSAFQIGVLICNFHRPDEPVEAYAAIIDQFDATLVPDGDGRLAWTVVVGRPPVEPGGLAGDYERAKGGERPIWLVEAACLSTALPPTIQRIAGSNPSRSASLTSS